MSTAIPLAGRRFRLRLPAMPASTAVSLVVLGVVAVWAAIPALSTGALEQNILLGAKPPGTAGHLLGTDALGRDVWLMIVAGARSAIVGPVVIALGSMTLGVVLGLAAAYRGGWFDWLVSRYVELTLAMPALLVAIVAAGVIGGGYWVSVAVMIVLYSPFDIRLVRSAALARINEPYLDAARLLGLSKSRIMMRHLLPSIRGLIGANLFLNMSLALVSLSALSFLGLGVSAQEADWGRQLNDSRTLFYSNPAAVAPGVAIILTAIALNLIGDWLSERSGVAEG